MCTLAVFYHRVARDHADAAGECWRQARRAAWAASRGLLAVPWIYPPESTAPANPEGGPRVIRFAIYSRVGDQDADSARLGQCAATLSLINGSRGEIAAIYVDTGVSRNLPWQERPQAKALLAALSQPRRPFDAVVIADVCRALGQGQLRSVTGLLGRHRVRLWAPEFGGPIHPGQRLHDVIITAFDGITPRYRDRFARTRQAPMRQPMAAGRQHAATAGRVSARRAATARAAREAGARP